uniref:Ig-like domain-containing protein n=1 Tax=Gopherus evgoodei TaxID=1825980 RepID=A0A8C4YIT5_9SAUR
HCTSVPHFDIDGLKNITVIEGESVTLECYISGHPAPTVSWYREDYQIESSIDFQITFKAGVARLVIREAFAEDSGRFTCTATNAAGTVSSSCHLHVQEKQQKPFFKKKLTSLRLRHFGPAHFDCRLTPIGDPTMVVEWLHDGKPLEAANRLRMINEFGYCSLDYGVAYPRDSGVITCRASNKYGTDHTSATLIVKDEKSLVEETQLPEGRKGLQRIEEMERMAHEGALAGVTEDQKEKQILLKNLRILKSQSPSQASLNARFPLKMWRGNGIVVMWSSHPIVNTLLHPGVVAKFSLLKMLVRKTKESTALL